MSGLRLQTRTALLVGVVVVLSAVVTFAAVGRFTLSALRQELEKSGLAIAQSVAELIVEEVIEEDAVSVREALMDVVERTGDVRYAFVTGFDGTVLAHTFDGGFPQALLDSRPEAPAPGVEEIYRQYSMGGEPIIEISQPLIEGMGSRLHLGLDESHLHSRIRRELQHLAAWFAAIAAVGILIGMWGARRTARPLERLAAAMESYGRGEPADLESLAAGGAEIERLRESFQSMQADLEAGARDLELSEERFREMAATIREAFWLVDWIEQRVVYISPAYETI